MRRVKNSRVTGGAAAVVLAGAGVGAQAQQSVSINLQGVQLANGVNQTRSSAPNTVSGAYRYLFTLICSPPDSVAPVNRKDRGRRSGNGLPLRPALQSNPAKRRHV